MNYKDYLIWVEKTILKLSDRKKQLFGLLCAKRLYPNYHFFKKKENWGDDIFIKEILERVKKQIINPNNNKVNYSYLLNKIDKIIPYPEDFDNISVSHALDASVIVENLLNFILTKDKKYIMFIPVSCIDTIYMHIQDKYSLYDEETEHHELFQSEINVQKKHLEYLVNLKKLDSDSINIFLDTFQNDNLISLDYLEK